MPPGTRQGRRLAAQRAFETARLPSISARVAQAVSARLRPLRPLIPGALRLTRRTLIVTAVSAPLAMLCAALLTTAPARAALTRWAPSQRLTPNPATRSASVAAALAAAPRPSPVRATSPAVDAPTPLPAPGVRLARDLLDPRRASPAAVAFSEAEAQRLGGALLAPGLGSGRAGGRAELPLQLRTLDQRWERLELQLVLPRGVRYLGLEPGRGLHESGAELQVEARGEALAVTLLRVPGSDPVPDGPLARLILQVDRTSAGWLPLDCLALRRDERACGAPAPGRLVLE